MTTATRTTTADPARLLLVDDNEVFRHTLAKAVARRGWAVDTAGDGRAATDLARDRRHGYAVVDVKLTEESGLDLIPQFLDINPAMRIVVLTGYASIATAVEAILRGATHYLAKPAEVDDIVAAFAMTNGNAAVDVATKPLSVNQLEWEHLQRTLLAHGGNVSAAARALKLHRRSLQRKLRKHACW